MEDSTPRIENYKFTPFDTVMDALVFNMGDEPRPQSKKHEEASTLVMADEFRPILAKLEEVSTTVYKGKVPDLVLALVVAMRPCEHCKRASDCATILLEVEKWCDSELKNSAYPKQKINSWV